MEILAIILVVAVFLLFLFITNYRRTKRNTFSNKNEEDINSYKPQFSDTNASIFTDEGEKRDIIFKNQRYMDADFGYSKFNPICTSSINSTNRYLSLLRTEEGAVVDWIRSGSVCVAKCNGVSDVMIDVYDTYLYGELYKTLYICPYAHSSKHTPVGFTLVEKDERQFDGDLLKVIEEREISLDVELSLRKLLRAAELAKQESSSQKSQSSDTKAKSKSDYVTNSKRLLNICNDLISEYEDKNNMNPSCREDLIESIKYQVERSKAEISQWKDYDTDYIRVAHTMLANTTFDLLASGKYNLYTGVLNPMKCGSQLLKVYDASMKWAVDRNEIDETTRIEQREYLMKCISQVG